MLTFVQALAGTFAPHPADRSALGTLPTHGYRYCEALRAATGFGYYMYPPAALAFEWDGRGRLQVWLHGEHLGSLDPGEGVQDPDATDAWNAEAPASLRGCLYPLLVRSPTMPNLVQVWTGWLVRTDPEWGVLVRAPANLARAAGYDLYEGYIETDQWYGPLFANLAITATHERVSLRHDWPFVQLQPIARAAFRQPATARAWGNWTEEDWQRYDEHVVQRARETFRPRGVYAIRTRQRPAPPVGEPGQYDESCESELGPC